MRKSSGLWMPALFLGLIGVATGLGIAASVLGPEDDSYNVYACVNQSSGVIRTIEMDGECWDYEEPLEWSARVYGDDSDGDDSDAGLSIKTRIVSDSLTLGHDTRTIAVFCRDDEVATGGGFDQSGDYDASMFFLASSPVSATTTGWSATAFNGTNRSQEMTVFAVCSSLGD
ncbi:MAG: hypothetical protein IH861_16055 [Chloroflexi bacterium]|nr:hypothetical protein [Chloroflexota bacterium]